MKRIPLTQGGYALVDNEDYESLSKFKWHNGHGYALRSTCVRIEDGKSIYRGVRMHRLILNAPKGVPIDHINRNRLDNRRSNLRLATPLLNNRNVGMFATNTSGVKGVYWHKKRNKWRATISVQNKRVSLGDFRELNVAALARKWGERLYHNLDKRCLYCEYLGNY